MLLNEFNDNYDIRYFMSLFYLRYIKNFKNNQNLKVKPLFTDRVIKKTLQGVGKTFSINNTRVTFSTFYLYHITTFKVGLNSTILYKKGGQI